MTAGERVERLRQLAGAYPGDWREDRDGAPYTELALARWAVILRRSDPQDGAGDYWVFTRDSDDAAIDVARDFALSEGDEPVALVDLDSGRAVQLAVTAVAVAASGAVQMPWDPAC